MLYHSPFSSGQYFTISNLINFNRLQKHMYLFSKFIFLLLIDI